MPEIMITLQKIRDNKPCKSGWEKVYAANKHLGMETEFPVASLLDSNDFDDCLWVIGCLPDHQKTLRLFAVWCARQVQHLMTDERSINALDVAEKHANGLATDEELAAAWAAARGAARDAALGAAWAAALGAAWGAAWDAARDAAWGAAWDAAWAAQTEKLKQILSNGGFI